MQKKGKRDGRGWVDLFSVGCPRVHCWLCHVKTLRGERHSFFERFKFEMTKDVMLLLFDMLD